MFDKTDSVVKFFNHGMFLHDGYTLIWLDQGFKVLQGSVTSNPDVNLSGQREAAKAVRKARWPTPDVL